MSETAGTGLEGRVDGKRVVVGGSRFVRDRSREGDPYALRKGIVEGSVVVAVAVAEKLAGIIILKDELRPDAPAMLAALRQAGIDRIVLASGDRQDVVDAVAGKLGITDAFGELTPSNKVDVVARESTSAPTMMVGDGVNDAPALASATVGIAMPQPRFVASTAAASLLPLRTEATYSASSAPRNTLPGTIVGPSSIVEDSPSARISMSWGACSPVAT